VTRPSGGCLRRVWVSRRVAELVRAEAELQGVEVSALWGRLIRGRAESACAERWLLERASRPAFGGRRV
jgi:hypothetical protein